MNALATAAPVLWYLNRATGVVLVVLFTVVVLMGVLATFGRAGRGAPRFLTQALHRHLSLLGMAMLAAHVITAVVDSYVDIRWWQAFWPFGAEYKPLWLGLGAVAFDLIVAIVVTSLLRTRFSHRGWRVIHLFSYAAWAASVAHGIGIGTDSASSWGRAVTFGCLAVVVGAVLLRLTRLRRLSEVAS